MKQLYLLLLSCLLVFESAGQRFTRSTTLQSIVPERIITLNGGARRSMGGKSRVIIAINLPPNTKSWYYSFSTSSNGSGTRNLNLLLQLTNLMTNIGITRAAVSRIEIPPGSMSIDSYLLDSYNADLFLRKTDLTGGEYYYWPEYSTTNTQQAIIPVTGINTGLVYIGLRNPGVWDAVNIKLEVVAEVYDY